MKGFSDTFIGALVVFLGLTIGGASLRYIITGVITKEEVHYPPQVIVVPPNEITNNEQTCYQLFAGQCIGASE